MDPFDQAFLAFLEQISGAQAAAAQQATLDQVLQAQNAALVILRELLADLNDPGFGLAAISGQIAALDANLITSTNAILTAVGSPQQDGSPVTLPTTPPAGYDVNTVAADVWGFPLFTGEFGAGAAGEQLYLVYANAAVIPSKTFIHWEGAPGFLMADYPVTDLALVPSDNPTPLLSTILPTDTPLSWLLREDSGHSWHYGFPSSDYVGAAGTSSAGGFWVLDYNPAQWTQLLAELFGVGSSVSAPIWPGLSGVTLGSSVALVDGLVVTGPLQGVVVTITAVPTPISYYPFGSIKSYVRAGAVIFTDDAGDSEFPEPLGPEDQLIVPKMMTSADLATFRVASGVVGTVTPFTIP
jgi:hypothetical protein